MQLGNWILLPMQEGRKLTYVYDDCKRLKK